MELRVSGKGQKDLTGFFFPAHVGMCKWSQLWSLSWIHGAHKTGVSCQKPIIIVHTPGHILTNCYLLCTTSRSFSDHLL